MFVPISKILLCYGFFPLVDGFVPTYSKSRSYSYNSSVSLHSVPKDISRRILIKNSLCSVILSVPIVGNISSAEAKDKVKEPITKESIAKSFQDVRYELEFGGVVKLGELVKMADYAGIMEFTKEYDLDFRKAKMGKARKFLTTKEDKEKAVLLCNAVTFDLIGMNKSSRPGQENLGNVIKFYQELKDDIQSFLDMEKLIDYESYEL